MRPAIIHQTCFETIKYFVDYIKYMIAQNFGNAPLTISEINIQRYIWYSEKIFTKILFKICFLLQKGKKKVFPKHESIPANAQSLSHTHTYIGRVIKNSWCMDL